MSNLQQKSSMPADAPSFVDMRAFARDRSRGVAVTSADGEDRYLVGRRVLDWAPGPVTAGVITLEAGSGAVPSLPADEFIIVIEGSLTLAQQEFTMALGPNQSTVLRQGAAFTWSAQGPVSLIFTRYNQSQPGDGAIVPIKENPQLDPTGTPPVNLLLTPPPACRNYTDYRSADGEFVCGTWDSTPYHRRAMFYPHFELMYLLEGSVRFVDGTGRSGVFSKGDIFLVEQNATCSWESHETVAKVYVIYRPA
ncbi:DUF861 domain-containing protein [Duganella sp. FT92W]|uniref:DUF861 domain-containing protein n=1 Tax=Pseudoduganella rivuli TaxID=2666085 RepID=A0A7X2IIJ4_9BURK|nr:cupin domain-containing protein [Pseudoduganella rivuli]MRV70475.1 DUF861 domain-containing protein [Pseudoduganella rivuli]